MLASPRKGDQTAFRNRRRPLLGPRASLTGITGLAYWDRGRLARREREALAASR